MSGEGRHCIQLRSGGLRGRPRLTVWVWLDTRTRWGKGNRSGNISADSWFWWCKGLPG